jgi:hypothetical protein
VRGWETPTLLGRLERARLTLSNGPKKVHIPGGASAPSCPPLQTPMTVWAECILIIYTNPVPTPQETHYVSATKPNRLMLFGETVAVYCENHTNPVCTSQETHYVSATKPNRLMLFGGTVAVYCENHKEHTDTLCGQNASK